MDKTFRMIELINLLEKYNYAYYTLDIPCLKSMDYQEYNKHNYISLIN